MSPEMLMQLGMFPLKSHLVIDAGRELGKMINRLLSQSFKGIWFIENQDDVRELLEKHKVKCLMSICFLEQNEPNGFQVVSALRSEHDSLERCLFITETEIKIEPSFSVRLVTQGKHTFVLPGKVVRVRESDNCAEGVATRMAITFENLRPEPCIAVRKFMDERQPLLCNVA